MQLKGRQFSVPVGHPGRALSHFISVVRDRRILALLGILALAAYLRLWNIHHLFSIFHDYDPGAHSLGGRFISQGYLPYRDFLLVHPPLYDLVLAGVYKIFGYSFFYGRYLSIALSLACIVLIYLIGKKMYHARAGLAAAALFAVSTDMVYLGRRGVQEALGILLVLVAVYLVFGYTSGGRHRWLLCSGVALGLAVSAKYVFVPVAAAVILAVAALSTQDGRWKSLRDLGRPLLWVTYACFAAIFFSLLLLFKFVLHVDVPIPFIDPMYLAAGDVMVAVLVFVVPFFISVVILRVELRVEEWCLALWELRRSRALWVLVAGAALGFICVTGFFLAKAPQQFVQQTILWQQNRPMTEFPSLVALARLAPLNPTFLRMAVLPVFSIIPLTLVLLNKRSFSRSDCFLAVALAVAVLLSQGFFYLPRYYAPVLPLLFLGMSWMVPAVDVEMLNARAKVGLLVFLSVLALSLSLSVILLRNFTGYDVLGPSFASNEEQVYEETTDFLEGVGAQKIYAANPIFVTISNNVESTLAFDSFALLWLEERPPREIVDDLKDEGVDYVVLDAWTRYWGHPYSEAVTELVNEVRRNSRLVKVIEPDSSCMVEIYRLGAEAEGVFNGDFDQWIRYEDVSLPLGWEATLIRGGGDHAIIDTGELREKECVKLIVCEDGQKDGKRESTHAGISQKILFPEDEIRVEILPQVNAAPSGRPELLPGIHFTDESGHSVVVGFSDMVTGEKVFEHESGYRLTVLKEAQMGQWSEQTIDLARYWERTGWPRPQELSMLVVNSAHYQNPGCYSFCIASAEVGGA